MSTKLLPMTHEELCVLAHAIISATRQGDPGAFSPDLYVKAVLSHSRQEGGPVAAYKACERAVNEVLAEFDKFDELRNSHVAKYSEILSKDRNEEKYLLDDQTYYLALMFKRLSLGDSGLLPEEQQWINEYRLTDEYKRIAEELASEAGD